MRLLRIEHPDTAKGMWNTHCPDGRPLVTYLSNRAVATLPMPPSQVYGAGGRRWYASCASVEDLHGWFGPADLQELIDLGFRIFDVEASECALLPMGEVIFTKESVSSWVDVTERFRLTPQEDSRGS